MENAPFEDRTTATAKPSSGARPRIRALLLFTLVLQGWHVFEHTLQVTQRTWLEQPQGEGITGSLVDLAPSHFLFNLVYLGLLLGIFLGFGMHRDLRRYGRVTTGLLLFALVWESWHLLEHAVQMAQYLPAPRPGGFPGILGAPNGPFIPYWLHFFYNLVAYLPLVIATLTGRLLRRR